MAASSLQDLNKMKVIDLKKELKMRGLDTVGKKNELIERLNASLESNNNEIDLSTETEDYMDDVLNVDEELDFEYEEDEELDFEYEEDEELDFEYEEDENVFENEENTSIASTDDSKIPRTNNRKLSESSDDSSVTKSTPRKISFNKILSVNNSENKPESTTEETSSKQEKEVVTAVGTTEHKRVIKLSNISAKERLEMRAKKFGTTLIADQENEASFVRFGDQVDTNIEKLKKRAERFGTSVSPIMSSLDTIVRLENKISIINPNNKLSIKERLGMRVKKFDTSLTAYQKNEARFARFLDRVEILRKRAERFGTSVSPILSALDRIEKRKARFGAVDGPAKKDLFV